MTGAPHAMASIITSPKGSGQSIGTIKAMARLKNSDFCASVDFPDEFDIRFCEKRLDHLLEIIVIDRVDFGRDLQRQSASLGDVDRAINPLLWRNASQESEIGRARRHGLQEVQRAFRDEPCRSNVHFGAGRRCAFEIDTPRNVGNVKKTGSCSGKSRRPCSVI